MIQMGRLTAERHYRAETSPKATSCWRIWSANGFAFRRSADHRRRHPAATRFRRRPSVLVVIPMFGTSGQTVTHSVR